jgi:hypothetical protein
MHVQYPRRLTHGGAFVRPGIGCFPPKADLPTSGDPLSGFG